MLDGTRFVVSAPKHKRKHSPTRLPDLLDTAHAGSRSAVPIVEDLAMLRLLTATMLPTAHHEEVVFRAVTRIV